MEVLRPICNTVPRHSYFRCMRGEVDHLPYTVQWNSFVLLDDECVLVGQEDMTSAFYLFAMPECWHEFFAVGKPLRLRQLKKNEAVRKKIQRKFGRKAEQEGYPCVRFLPMGWISAVGVMQAIHRGLMLREPPVGQGCEIATRSGKSACY